jgi:hypothetical protein
MCECGRSWIGRRAAGIVRRKASMAPSGKAAALAERGYVASTGKPCEAAQVASMLGHLGSPCAK